MLNKNQGLFIFSLLILFISVLSVVSANECDLSSDSFVTSDASSSFSDVQSKVNNASSGATVYLDNKTYNGDKDIIAIVAKNLTIHGGSESDNQAFSTLDASGKCGIFTLSNSNVTFINIRFINAKVNVSGGAIYVSVNSTATIINSTFINNTAQYGGAICSFENSTVNISNSNFTNNSGLYGGAITSVGVLLVENSIFETNKANSGGAIYGYRNSTITTTNSTFRKNTASSNGGAIYALNSLNIINSTLSNNNASTGGAVYSKSLNITNSNFTDNNAKNFGGAVYLDSGKLDTTNASFKNNSAKSGGAIFINVQSNVSLTLSKFETNTVTEYGGAVYLESNSNMTITTSEFKHNRATVDGGAIYAESNTTIINSIFFNNSAIRDGGVIYAYIKLNIINSSLINNSAGRYGGAIAGSSDRKLKTENPIITIEKSVLENNTAGNNGGAIYGSSYSSINIIQSNLTKNGVSSLGGGIYAGYKINVTESNFIKNTADYGGAIYSIYNITATNSNFTDNIAFSKGGALYGVQKIIIDNSNFINNTAGDEGGAIANYPTSTILANNSNFINNSAVNGGGAISADIGSNVNLTNSTFINNTSIKGGAILTHDSSELLINSSLFKNNTGDNGGAIYTEGTTKTNITDSEFKNNTAKDNGGAIYSENTVSVVNSNFTNNSAEGFGASIYSEGNVSINKSAINDKNVTGGFVVFIAGNGTLNVTNTTVNSNLPVTNDKNEMYVQSSYSDYISGAKLNIILPFGSKGQITVYDGDKPVYVGDSFGVLNYINIPNLDVGSHNLKVEFTDNAGVKLNKTITTLINKGDAHLDLQIIKDVNDVNIFIISNVDGVIELYVNGKLNTTLQTVNDIAYTSLKNLPLGEYLVTVKYVNNTNVNGVNTTNSFIISNLKTHMILNSSVDGRTVNITASLNTDGDVNFYVNGELHSTVKTQNKTATLQLSNLSEGNYTVSAVFEGSDVYVACKNTINFTILDEGIVITAESVVMYRGNGTRLQVQVTKSNKPLENFNISIKVNGVTYNKTTDGNGLATLGLSGLIPDEYTAVISSKDLNETITINTTVIVLSTIVIDDLTKMYKNGSQLYATLVDGQGKPIAGVEASFNINGVFYKRLSDSNGRIGLNINLRPGVYIATINNYFTGQNRSAVVTILSSVVSDNLTKYYKNNSHYYVTLLDGRGKHVDAGLRVIFNINGVFYERYSDSNGMVKLSINLAPGEYIITVQYGDLTQSNTVTVLSNILSENIEMTTALRIPYTVSVLGGDGTPAEGIHVKFNINGVFYDKFTDENGVAVLNINLMEGSYIITSILDNGLMQSNTVTIKE